jgi:hypothetical protein
VSINWRQIAYPGTSVLSLAKLYPSCAAVNGRPLSMAIQEPLDLPVQHPVKFERALNAKHAKALGLTARPSLLVAADEVIE